MPTHDHFAKAMTMLAKDKQWAVLTGTDFTTEKPTTVLQWRDPTDCPKLADVVALATQIEAGQA